jgi:hypothetical protein
VAGVYCCARNGAPCCFGVVEHTETSAVLYCMCLRPCAGSAVAILKGNSVASVVVFQ